ncbi:FAD-dependent oxidoreductase [Vibrio cholerae]|uniref:FAD-dependent oxidoreductase n=2 Tax=Vibrio cholerae TaxID=666 RepID=UPI002FE540B9
MTTEKIIVIGGGFYGLYIAEYYSLKGYVVDLFEKEDDYMQRASLKNQARVHNGYHYPRSTLTALRSRVSYPRFKEEFKETIYSNFKKYYLVGKPLGKISGRQFELFCKRIKAPIKKASIDIESLVNKKLIDGVFETDEIVFDAVKLKKIMLERAKKAGVNLKNNSDIIKVEKDESKGLKITIREQDGRLNYKFSDQVFNCTYSGINRLNKLSGFEIIPLRHELTEMCLIKIPNEIEGMSFTVMCGPFFSIMPFPSTDYYTLSHVRYTPHCDWRDDECVYDNYDLFEKQSKKSAWNKIIRDAQRYIPILKKSQYIDSLWEVKTILPISDVDDSRPILFKFNHGVNGYHCIMGGKIDNIYDAIEKIENFGLI